MWRSTKPSALLSAGAGAALAMRYPCAMRCRVLQSRASAIPVEASRRFPQPRALPLLARHAQRHPTQRCCSKHGADDHHTHPAGLRIRCRAQGRAHRTTDEVASDVSGGDAMARSPIALIDHALIGDMHALHRDIQQQHADDQQRDRVRRKRQHAPRQQQHHQPAPAHAVAMTVIGPMPGAIGGQRTGRTDQAEQADHRRAIAIARPGQQKRQRGPEHAQAGKDQPAQYRARTQHRIVAQQRQHRGHQLRVRQLRIDRMARQPAPQQPGGEQ